MATAYNDKEAAIKQAETWIETTAKARAWPDTVKRMALVLVVDAAGLGQTAGQFWAVLGNLFDKADDPGGPAADYTLLGWGKLADTFLAAATASSSALSAEEADSLWSKIKGTLTGTADDVRNAVKDTSQGAGMGIGLAAALGLGLWAWTRKGRRS